MGEHSGEPEIMKAWDTRGIRWETVMGYLLCSNRSRGKELKLTSPTPIHHPRTPAPTPAKPSTPRLATPKAFTAMKTLSPLPPAFPPGGMGSAADDPYNLRSSLVLNILALMRSASWIVAAFDLIGMEDVEKDVRGVILVVGIGEGVVSGRPDRRGRGIFRWERNVGIIG
jgi:hypothetical protein